MEPVAGEWEPSSMELQWRHFIACIAIGSAQNGHGLVGVGGGAGTAASSGTTVGCWHFGQRSLRPAAVSGAFKREPQLSQIASIDIESSLGS